MGVVFGDGEAIAYVSLLIGCFVPRAVRALARVPLAISVVVVVDESLRWRLPSEVTTSHLRLVWILPGKVINLNRFPFVSAWEVLGGRLPRVAPLRHMEKVRVCGLRAGPPR